MNVCVCVCVCVCVYACMCVCVYVCVYGCASVHVCVGGGGEGVLSMGGWTYLKVAIVSTRHSKVDELGCCLLNQYFLWAFLLNAMDQGSENRWALVTAKKVSRTQINFPLNTRTQKILHSK